MNQELPDIHVEFRKSKETRDQLANICQITEKAREFQENIYFWFLATLKPLAVWIDKLWKILKEMGIPSTWPSSREIWLQVKKQQLELVMEQQTASKRGKGGHKDYILSPCLFNFYAKFSSVPSFSLVQLFATLWTAAHRASLSITNSWSLLKLMPIELVMQSNYLIFCHPLLLLPSFFPSIRVSSNESVLHIR